MIFKSIKDFMYWRDDTESLGLQEKKDIWMTSGGFDPLHIGHLRCIQDTVRLANDRHAYPVRMKPVVLVLVNCDKFLEKKKGYAFMPLEERMEIISGIKGVDYVVPWHMLEDDNTVQKAIELIRPKVFTKGGDRVDESTIPEWGVCQSVGCKVLTGIGG